MARKVKLTEGDLMAALLAEYDLPPLLDNDITPDRLAAKSQRGDKEFWRKVLEKRVEAGELIKVAVHNPATKRPAAAYRPKPK